MLPLLNVSTMNPMTGNPKNVAAGLSEVSLCAFTGPVNEVVKSNNAALTASIPVANPYVVAVVPLKISVWGGLANVRSGSVTPGANQIGPAGNTRNASSATASAVTSSPDRTLISVMPPNRPPLPN